MSMDMQLKRLTDASMERIMANPKKIGLCFDLPDTKPFSFLDFLKKYFSKKAPPENNPPERDPCFDEEECSLDKSWDVLCFLFCGATFGTGPDEKNFPANFLYCSESTVNIGDLYGYGPPWMYSSKEVKEIADFLDSQKEENLRNRFILADLKEADPYPSIWNDYEDESSTEWREEQDWFLGSLPALKRFVRETADRDLALVFYLS